MPRSVPTSIVMVITGALNYAIAKDLNGNLMPTWRDILSEETAMLIAKANDQP